MKILLSIIVSVGCLSLQAKGFKDEESLNLLEQKKRAIEKIDGRMARLTQTKECINLAKSSYEVERCKGSFKKQIVLQKKDSVNADSQLQED